MARAENVGGSFPTAVVADDEIYIAQLLALLLEDMGLTVAVTYNGEDALRAVVEQRPRLVLTDVMMPRLRGDDLCRRIKANPTTAVTTVVIMSSLPPDKLVDCPADALIAKPFDLVEVEELVRRILEESDSPSAPPPKVS